MTHADDGDAETADKVLEGAPPPPTESILDPNDPRTTLQTRLRTVLFGLPAYFKFDNTVAGINATDLFNLNSLLGASIESEVVNALNAQRKLWDPEDEWQGYVFERQSQTFPDVRLVKKNFEKKPEIAIGIELKGWFLMAKEGKPSFRFTTSAAACAAHDLLVVVPWYLDNVLSGRAVIAQPYVVSAKLAAESRNYYWQYSRNVRDAGEDRSITTPLSATPYPTKDVEIADIPAHDPGHNFGRVARSPGLMKPWIDETNQTLVLGIRVGDWYKFFKTHTDNADLERVSANLSMALEKSQEEKSEAKAQEVAALIESLVRLLAES